MNATKSLLLAVVLATALVSTAGAASERSSITIQPGDFIDAQGLYFACSYSRPSGRRALACSEDGDPRRALGVVVFRDRIVVIRGSKVLYRAFR
jgi:hypothetical protein